MNDGARWTGGLDPARDRAQRRSRWGRRSLYGFPRRERAEGGPDGGSIYGALDLGTNNCRLLVARPSGDGFHVIDAFSRIIRLGDGVSASGRLNEAAIERAVEALGICRDKMKNRGVTRARLIATEACRAAANGAEFRARVADEVGLELEVIAAVVIGGASLSGGEGTVLGSIIGAMLMAVIRTGCTFVGVHNWVQEMATGAIIVVAVAVDRLRHRGR